MHREGLLALLTEPGLFAPWYSSLTQTTAQARTGTPAQPKATAPMKRAQPPSGRGLTIQLSWAVALPAQTATIPLEGLGAPSATVKYQAQPTPALARQEQLQGKFLRRMQGLAG
jgi:hypothetical protein